jgi:hypothetical protein
LFVFFAVVFLFPQTMLVLWGSYEVCKEAIQSLVGRSGALVTKHVVYHLCFLFRVSDTTKQTCDRSIKQRW